MLIDKRHARQHATIEKQALDVLLTTMTFRVLTTCLTLELRSQGAAFIKSVMLYTTKIPHEFRYTTLPAAYMLQHTESPLAELFSDTVAILTNALHVCVTGSSWM